MSTRRAILKTGGAAVVILGVAGGGWALTRAPKKARAPWEAAGDSFGDQRLDVLAYAILAPNPHNMQPWRIELVGDDAFTVYCDTDRLLPETDPPNRQITIGFGCFLELVRQAAAEKDLYTEVVYFPEGEPFPNLDARPVAHVQLKSGARVERDPLFGGVLDRRTNRAPYDLTRIPDAAALDAIKAASVDGVLAEATADPARVEELRQLGVDAWTAEWENAETRRESIEVTRIGKKEINESPWGLALAGPLMEGINAIGLLTREDMDVAGTASFDQTLEFYNKACRTATAFVWTTTATNTRRDQLEAGRAWVRMQLAANAAGIAFHPLSQALQEFPEMAPHYEKAHRLLGGNFPGGPHTVQMLVRLGYAKAPPPAPREKLTAKLIEG